MPFQDPPADDCLAGGGEMGRLIRAHDWSATPVGPIGTWPRSLKTAVSICLGSRYPIVIWWGKQTPTQFYNDAYIPILGRTKHPGSLGQSAKECWSEIWHIIDPMLEGVFATGEATWSEDFLYVIARNLPREEGYFTFSYSPIRDDAGAVGGIFCAVTETTGRILGERRLRTLQDLGRTGMEAECAEEACEVAARTLAANPADIPFASIYLIDREARYARLVSTAGLEAGIGPAPDRIDLSKSGDESAAWPLRRVYEVATAELVTDLSARFGLLPGGPWPESADNALVLPIPAPGRPSPTGFLITGLSPRRVVDADYRTFFDLIAGHVAAAVANARAYEAEKRRAEALAEIDRVKTAFFSNVSHEFRTPLTLMLGPVEDALADTVEPLPAIQRERLETAHRSSLRLLKLVNTLLDFARTEAGRVQAVYEPTDLAALTAELASNFRSACDKAGLRIVVDCPTLPEPVYVDRDMWEKVVLNLLSNAFKFTLEGEIAVRLRAVGGAAELAVRDTGTGIPAGELPRVFERFHRVEGSRGRTHEGTGIGLALVQELVKLHGGSVRAESTPGIGSTFLVSVPTGTAHLPADRIGAARTLGSTAVGAGAFIEEALRWLPDQEASRSFPGSVGNAREAFPPEGPAPRPPTGAPERDGEAAPRPRILWADDNADMRDYVRRLLGERYDVEAVPDGEAALEAARARPPDLVLTDVMMPRLDGFDLLNGLRADPATRAVPVILLSARAGEESRVEGLEAGADDYLVKPFSARELLARVGANLEMARVRREAGERVTHIMESIPDGLVTLDREWRYTFANAPAERLLGLPRSDLLGRGLWDVFPQVVSTETERQLRRVASEQVTREFQGYHAGWGRWYENRAFPMPEGGVAVYFRDITERRRAEEALRQSEERFRRYFELGLIGMAITSPTKGCLEVNDEICRMLGYTRQELVRKTWAEMTHPDDLAADVAQFDRVMGGEIDGYTMDKRWIRKDGRTIDTTISLKCLRREDGSVDYFVALLQDVTDRKRAAEDLRVANERLDLAMRGSNIGIWDLDLAPRGDYRRDPVRFINIWEHLGYDPAEFPTDAEASRALGHPDDLPEVDAAVAACLADETREIRVENRIRHKDGSWHWLLTLGRVVRDATGSPARLIGTVQDITERKRSEEELHRAALVLANVSDSVIATDLEGTITFWNEGANRLFGWTAAEMVGRSYADRFPEPERSWVAEQVSSRGAGTEWNGEYRDYRKDGSQVWIDARVGRVTDTAGRSHGIIGLARDITERKQAEEAVRESQAKFRALAENVPSHVWTCTLDKQCDYVNPQFLQYTGKSEAELLGDWRLDIIHPDDHAAMSFAWEHGTSTGAPAEFEARVRRHDGAWRWFQIRAAPVRDERGQLIKWFGVNTDIDDLKRAQESLRAGEEQLAAELAAMKRLQEVSTRLVQSGDGVALLEEILDAAIAITAADMGNIQLLDRASGVLQIVASRGFASPFLDFFAAVRDGRAACGHAMQSGDRVVIEDVTQSPVFVGTPALDAILEAGVRAVQSTPLVARSGRLVGMLSTYYRTPRRPAGRDLHVLDLLARQAADRIERTWAEEELRVAKAAAEAANRAKDEFLANVSHEIRTPFGAILGMTELVLDTPLTDDQRRCLETARSASENLLGLVNDLLDFSKIEAGKLALDAAEFPVRRAVGEALRALAPRAHRKGLELAWDVGPDVPETVVGDAPRLRQVLLNLTGNAVKFTDAGEVVVQVEVAEGSGPASEATLRFVVSDTGIGIPADARQRIFRAFEQADLSTTRRYGGTGLGLTIAAEIVTLMGGTITLESEEGRGSTFAFSARFGRPPHPREPSAARVPVRLHGLPVLVVDNSATSRRIAAQWLSGWGMRPTPVADAPAALEALTGAAAAGRPYAVAILDARTPGVAGLGSAIRERVELSETRLVLLTAGSPSGDPSLSVEPSSDARLLKPAPPDELLEAIDRVMGRPAGGTPPAFGPAGLPPPAAPLRVLVAEDDELSARYMDRLLGRAGHRVRLAANGREALDLLGIGGQPVGPRPASEFDVLVLDLHMPGLDGSQVVQAIRDRERRTGGHLAVIALTARSRPEDRERCLAAGMDEFLSKPVRAAELFARISKMVTVRPGVAPAAPDPGGLPGLVDAAVLLAACGGDADMLRDMGQDLRTYAPGRMAAVGDALRAGDAPRLREAAHKLGGLVSAFSTAAAAVAADLEDLAAGGRIETARPLVDRLDRMTAALNEQVAGLAVEGLRRQAGVSDDVGRGPALS